MQITLEYKSLQKCFRRQHLPHLLFCSPLVSNFPTELFCKQSPVYEVFWPLLPHPSTDRNETRTWSSLPPRNLCIKFGANPSTIFLVIVVTHTNQHRWRHIPSLSRVWKITTWNIQYLQDRSNDLFYTVLVMRFVWLWHHRVSAMGATLSFIRSLGVDVMAEGGLALVFCVPIHFFDTDGWVAGITSSPSPSPPPDSIDSIWALALVCRIRR